MTIIALWQRTTVDEVWCVADSRITGGDETVITDNGPKILPIPVVCNKQQEGTTNYTEAYSYSYGFAFAGSTLAATSTHSMVSACTQNLGCRNEHSAPAGLKSVAELFRETAEGYIKDISGRQTGSASRINKYFFSGFVFGFCKLKNTFMAYAVQPVLDELGFRVLLVKVPLEKGMYYPMGSGVQDFVRITEEHQKTDKNHGVMETLKIMVENEVRKDVGGFFQVGAAHKNNFQLLPILSKEDKKTYFLGWDTEAFGDLDGYRIGYLSISQN